MYLMLPVACVIQVYAVKPVEKFLRELGHAVFQIHEAWPDRLSWYNEFTIKNAMKETNAASESNNSTADSLRALHTDLYVAVGVCSERQRLLQL